MYRPCGKRGCLSNPCRPQAEEALAAGSPETAAAKGRALLNLRLADAEGGLLGRTLLTLVNNKARHHPAPLPCTYVPGLRWAAATIGPPKVADLSVARRADGDAAIATPAVVVVTLPCQVRACSVDRPASVQGGGSEPLPPHKLSPHDIVRVRPSKGDGGGAPLAEGVVYRVKDSAITVAGGVGACWACDLLDLLSLSS